jgi:diadenosine tetraphosphate (Ap4A) HIT family hydrolase
MTFEGKANQTLVKFGFPATVIAEYETWVVLVRPKQITLGSLILACREDATAFAEISPAAFGELAQAVADVETNLRREVNYERINYLMLMMVDPNVHFHVLPRYEGSRTLNGIEYPDSSWPGPPALGNTADLSASDMDNLITHLRTGWQKK